MFGFSCCWQSDNNLTLSLHISEFARFVAKNSQIFLTEGLTVYFYYFPNANSFNVAYKLLQQQAEANLPGFPFPVSRMCFWATSYGWPRDLLHLWQRNVASTSENCRKASGVWPRKIKPSKTRQNCKTLSFPLSTAFISYRVVLSSASDYLRLPNTWVFYR